MIFQFLLIQKYFHGRKVSFELHLMFESRSIVSETAETEELDVIMEEDEEESDA